MEKELEYRNNLNMEIRRNKGLAVNNNNNIYILLFIYSILFTWVSYYSANASSLIYDYPFHSARILGLAHSIANKDFLPNLNYLFLNGSGYAVSMFYGNWLFYIPAVIYLKTHTATIAFITFVFQSTILTVYSTYFVLRKVTKSNFRAVLGSIAISCSVVYFGYGMTAVIPLISLLFYSIYRILYCEKLNPVPLAIVISLLVQTHILSTFILAIASILLVFLNVNKWSIKK